MSRMQLFCIVQSRTENLKPEQHKLIIPVESYFRQRKGPMERASTVATLIWMRARRKSVGKESGAASRGFIDALFVENAASHGCTCQHVPLLGG